MAKTGETHKQHVLVLIEARRPSFRSSRMRILGVFCVSYEHRWTLALGQCDNLSVVYLLGIIILHCYQLLSDGILSLQKLSMRWYLSIACSVYWLYIVISYYQRRVSWQSTQRLSRVPYYRVLSDEMVFQYSMQRLLVVFYYWLLSGKSILVEHVVFITCALLSNIIDEMVSQYSMQRLLVVHCYLLLSEEYLGRARRGCRLCLIIEQYQMVWYISKACSVYWQ